jgi:DnaK suppressor protein
VTTRSTTTTSTTTTQIAASTLPASQTAATQDRLRQKLMAQAAMLERSLQAAVQEGRQSSTDDLQDAADHAVQSYQKELLFLQGTQGHSQLSQVRAALERMDSNDESFGECQHCGTRIGEKRLEAVPWTPYCIACQEKLERGEIADPQRAA